MGSGCEGENGKGGGKHDRGGLSRPWLNGGREGKGGGGISGLLFVLSWVILSLIVDASVFDFIF